MEPEALASEVLGGLKAIKTRGGASDFARVEEQLLERFGGHRKAATEFVQHMMSGGEGLDAVDLLEKMRELEPELLKFIEYLNSTG